MPSPALKKRQKSHRATGRFLLSLLLISQVAFIAPLSQALAQENVAPRQSEGASTTSKSRKARRARKQRKVTSASLPQTGPLMAPVFPVAGTAQIPAPAATSAAPVTTTVAPAAASKNDQSKPVGRPDSGTGQVKGSPQQTRGPITAEAPTMSEGGRLAGELQSNPDAYSEFAGSSAPAKGESPKLVATDPDPNAPALGITFDAVNFNEQQSGFFHIPPDPAGAAGPNHVVNVTNTMIEFYTKTGVRQYRQRLGRNSAGSVTGAFFEPVAPANSTFDPKVVYDQYAGRFVVLTMERVEASGPTPNSSRVFLAVSDDSDPNGTWYFQTLNTEETIGGRQSWADFPGLAVDSEAVYFTTNMFAHNNQTSPGTFTGQRTWIMAKTPWYSGGTPTATRYDTVAMANASPNGNDGGATATTMQPTQMYGDTPGGVGTYLLAYSGLNDGVNLYLQTIRIDNPLSSPTFTTRYSIWGTKAAHDNTSGFPGAPQLGTARTIATNDRRISQNGVFRNGSIYCAAPILPPVGTDTNQVTVHWFRIDPAAIDTTLADPPPTDQGNIGGEDIAPGTFTFFPSVAVDALNNLAVGFAASAPTIYPGAYFTGRLAAAPPGTTQAAGALRAGQDFYVRTFNSPSPATSRWGDYTGMWLDPADETTFWVYNEYALPRGTTGLGSQAAEDGRWGTAWGSFSLAVPGTVPAGGVIISEFRLRGPAGAEDEFIELYNNTNSDIVVADVNPPATGPSGWALVSSDAPLVPKVIVPTGVRIPARGNYLIANNTGGTGYSLSAYPSGNNGPNTIPTSTTATPDRTYTTNIPDNTGIALFRSATPANFTLTDRLDAVGPDTEANPIFKEGTGYPAQTTPVNTREQSYLRKLPGGCTGSASTTGSGNCTSLAAVTNTPGPSSSHLQDSNDNASDFIYVNTTGANVGSGQRIGAPGPQNLSSPTARDYRRIAIGNFDPTVSTNTAPNRVRDFTSVPFGTAGTLEYRKSFTNNTGAAVTRLRLRVVDITTFPNITGVADLRVLTSSDIVVNGVTVRGTTLETPPTQPFGGGFNSTLSATTITLATPLANGASINLRLLFGVELNGKYRLFVTVEALPN